MDSTLVAPRNIAVAQQVSQEEPNITAITPLNIFDSKIPLGLACALVLPAFLSVLASGVLAVLIAPNGTRHKSPALKKS